MSAKSPLRVGIIVLSVCCVVALTVVSALGVLLYKRGVENSEAKTAFVLPAKRAKILNKMYNDVLRRPVNKIIPASTHVKNRYTLADLNGDAEPELVIFSYAQDVVNVYAYVGSVQTFEFQDESRTVGVRHSEQKEAELADGVVNLSADTSLKILSAVKERSGRSAQPGSVYATCGSKQVRLVLVDGKLTVAGPGADKCKAADAQKKSQDVSSPDTEVIDDSALSDLPIADIKDSTLVNKLVERSDNSAKAEKEWASTNTVPLRDVYQNIVQQSSEDGKKRGFHDYMYAVVDITDDDIPELLIGAREKDYAHTVAVVSYNAKNKSIKVTEDALNFGVAGAGGYRGDLKVDKEKHLLYSLSWSSGTGEGQLKPVRLADGEIIIDNPLWNGRIDKLPEKYQSLESVQWFGIEKEEYSSAQQFDWDGLNPARGIMVEISGEAKESDTEDEDLPDDPYVVSGTVFSGTCGQLQDKYPQVVNEEFAKAAGDTWTDMDCNVLVLDQGREFTTHPDYGTGPMEVTQTAVGVHLHDEEAQLNGRHLTIRLNPQMSFPHDADPLEYVALAEYEVLDS